MSSKRKQDRVSFHFPSFCFPLLTCSLILVVFCFFGVNSFPQIIDRIVAVVNDQVITLTDLRIVEAFSLYEDELEGEGKERLSLLLERMINQKIVIKATSEDISVEPKELEAEHRKVLEKLGSEEFQKRLEEFSLGLEDLKLYLREKIFYQRTLSRRFGQGVMVNLEEIENHYKQIYIPSLEKKGLKPRPLMDILDEIEVAIRQKKIKKQTADWIDNLKKQAEIEIKLGDLDKIEDR